MSFIKLKLDLQDMGKLLKFNTNEVRVLVERFSLINILETNECDETPASFSASPFKICFSLIKISLMNSSII